MIELSPVEQRFILHWGEMGSRWGINRTIAQIHALLYISPKALNAEEIASTLSIARSNVSTSVKELEGWGIVKAQHVLGDRREHYESLKDVWEIFRVVAEERKRRELDPTVQALRDISKELASAEGEKAYTQERIEALLEFMTLISNSYDQLRRVPTDVLVPLLKAEHRLEQLLGFLGK